MRLLHLIERRIEDLVDMEDKFKDDERINITAESILRNRVKKIKYKGDFTNSAISSSRRTSYVHATILFKLFELIMLDVIEGVMVFLNKKQGAKFYVDSVQPSKEYITGKGLDKRDTRMPVIDLRATGYRIPMVVFDPGYKRARLCEVRIPYYLYALLIDQVNSGKKYIKGTDKQLWANARKRA